jgi:hypothetical protein
MTTTYTLTVCRTGDHYEVTIAELAQTATGTTWQEAVDNAHRAISATLIENAQTKQRHNKAKKRRTVA